MKKCLHLKKTKRHWRRKPPKVMTWREKKEAERAARAARVAPDPFALGMGMAAGAAALMPLLGRRTLSR